MLILFQLVRRKLMLSNVNHVPVLISPEFLYVLADYNTKITQFELNIAVIHMLNFSLIKCIISLQKRLIQEPFAKFANCFDSFFFCNIFDISENQ